ncbi:MAG: tonB-system energizer ExbB, partial [Mesorhizobium sp.]
MSRNGLFAALAVSLTLSTGIAKAQEQPPVVPAVQAPAEPPSRATAAPAPQAPPVQALATAPADLAIQ